MHRASQGLQVEVVIEHLCPGVGRGERVCLHPSEGRDPRAELTHTVSQRLHVEAVIEHLCPSMGRDKQKMLENELSADKFQG